MNMLNEKKNQDSRPFLLRRLLPLVQNNTPF